MFHVNNCRSQSGKIHWFYIIWILVMVFFSVLTMISTWYIVGLLAGMVALFFFTLRPNSALHSITMEKMTTLKIVCIIVVTFITILACILPMKVFPLWNGDITQHRNQYELMAENLLEGRLHFVYGDEEQLEKLNNPYDPIEREEVGAEYHWDHAYYNGKYYMYFGIVPVLLTFLPYRIITGLSLTTYHATQLYVAMSIVGIFAIFFLLTRLFFRKTPFAVYLVLSVAFSVMSVWYSIAEPALYCTAITAAVAMEIWSLYFFVRAVWYEKQENKQLWNAAAGALFGALTFGCRPPIALANLVVIPMLIIFLRQHKFTMKLLGKLTLAALPYIVVGAALMLYNYVRFDDPFEFGQKYQLTVVDQSQYGITMNVSTIKRVIHDGWASLFGKITLTRDFPYILQFGGVFCNFPILFYIIGGFLRENRESLRSQHLCEVVIGMVLTIMVIIVLDIIWTPYLLERYHMDIYFLAGIACYICIGGWYRVLNSGKQKILNAVVCVMGIITLASSVFLFFRAVSINSQWVIDEMERILFDGI